MILNTGRWLCPGDGGGAEEQEGGGGGGLVRRGRHHPARPVDGTGWGAGGGAGDRAFGKVAGRGANGVIVFLPRQC